MVEQIAKQQQQKIGILILEQESFREYTQAFNLFRLIFTF
jgi:hypothetical protein